MRLDALQRATGKSTFLALQESRKKEEGGEQDHKVAKGHTRMQGNKQKSKAKKGKATKIIGKKA